MYLCPLTASDNIRMKPNPVYSKVVLQSQEATHNHDDQNSANADHVYEHVDSQ